jgi:hypothetical protein
MRDEFFDEYSATHTYSKRDPPNGNGKSACRKPSFPLRQVGDHDTR